MTTENANQIATTDDIDPVVARLRESKIKSEEDDLRSADIEGKAWAENYAEAIELRRLEIVRETSDNWPITFLGEVFAHDSMNAFEAFVFAIRPDHAGDRDCAAAFWREVFGDEGFDPGEHFNEFVQRFADAALEVWDRVKDQL